MKRKPPTPGPWEAHQFDKMDTVLYANDRKNIIAVADGHLCEDLENFQLMAAAPDMLKALKDLLAYSCPPSDLLLKVEAAIAKAEGRS